MDLPDFEGAHSRFHGGSMARKTGLVCLILGFHLSFASAQETTGNLEGRVVDSQQEPIPGVSVVVSGPSLQGRRGVPTNANGFFRLLGLPGGSYTVSLTHVSYQRSDIKDVVVNLGNTTSLGTVTLNQKAVEMNEVLVLGSRPFVDPVSADVGKTLSRKEFENLPIERDYRSVASILPHANMSYYGDGVEMGGATGIENRFYINGNDVTDSFRGLGGTNLPYNFIKEVEVKIGGYEPEYRSSLGGIINAVTFSGGNELSGQVFGFFSNSNFGSQQRLVENEPSKGAFSQYDFGVSIGGPIVKDLLWFYGAFNPSYRKEDIALTGLSYYPDNFHSTSFAGKLTWKATDALDFALTVLGDPSIHESVGLTFGNSGAQHYTNPDPMLNEITAGGYNASLDGRYVVSQALFLEASLSWATRGEKYMPRTTAGWTKLFVYDYQTATFSGGYPERVDVASDVVSAKASGSYAFEDHLMKAGFEYKTVLLNNREFRNTSLWVLSDSSYLWNETQASGKIRNHLPSIFAQDSWSINKNLRLMGGVRWDGLFVIAPNGALAARALGQIEPRVGLTYLPGDDGAQKISISAGRYSEDLMTAGSAFMQNPNYYSLGVAYTTDPRTGPATPDTVMRYGSLFNQQAGVQDLKGQYYDEVTIGYERLLADDLKATARGIYRTLREMINDSYLPDGTGYYGNPGSGPLSIFPKPQREYLALELTLEKSWASKVNLLVSYVLSRNYGNTEGIYNGGIPNIGPEFDNLESLQKNAVGLLGTDRTHVFKLSGAYQFDFGLTSAVSFFWETGTPLNEYYYNAQYTILNYVPKGTAGRLPSLWDLNLRLAYNIGFMGDRVHPKLILDVFHIGSQRTVVRQYQFHYLGLDNQGQPTDPDPEYGRPAGFQPPMSARIGLEVNF